MAIETDDGKIRSLARAIARGQSASLWAKKHSCRVEWAEELCLLPEFQDLVETQRRRVADRAARELMTPPPRRRRRCIATFRHRRAA